MNTYCIYICCGGEHYLQYILKFGWLIYATYIILTYLRQTCQKNIYAHCPMISYSFFLHMHTHWIKSDRFYLWSPRNKVNFLCTHCWIKKKHKRKITINRLRSYVIFFCGTRCTFSMYVFMCTFGIILDIYICVIICI